MVKSIFILLIPLMYSSCDIKPGPVPYYPIPRESKRYIIFPKGSYWIYHEMNSSGVDTVFLYRSETERKNGASRLGYDYERYTAGYRNSLTGDSSRGFGDPFHADQTIWSYDEASLNGPFANSILTFLHPLNVGETRRYAEDWTLTYDSLIESIKINGVPYFDVMVFRHNVWVLSNQSERIYFAKDVGVIRRELFNGQVWQLTRYFINN